MSTQLELGAILNVMKTLEELGRLGMIDLDELQKLYPSTHKVGGTEDEKI